MPFSEINADYQRSADTHLIRLPLPAFPGIHLYLKDESSHPTGSLKHRLARSAVSLWLVQRLDQRRHANYRVLFRVNRPFRRPISPACWGCRLSL
ncbi:cysteine synthase B [Klebsiella pneumoniae subsp. ozaenae]|uniref:Cysteine synthase B n=1 Tax=Klebsiella pneumoniae subsp. ozaenae TaxID=574 RepID=A0A378BWV5_KLEPO|nr:cysteine synthase B [Klebsiella pneumoniae subsp. ozaenae]